MPNISFTPLLHALTVDSKDNGEEFYVTDRLKAIEQLLAPTDYELLKAGKLFRLYGRQPLENREVVLISSHIDCVYSRCFCEEHEEEFKGTFDNRLTNAAVLYNMLQERFGDEVVIAFTGDEEKDSGGALELISYLIQQTQCVIRFVIVTDVTNEGWDSQSPFTIENDLGIVLFTGHQIVEWLTPYLYTFVHHAEPDESWDYDSVNLPCLTLCCPVSGNMHSDEGVVVRKAGLPVYCQVLQGLENGLAGL